MIIVDLFCFSCFAVEFIIRLMNVVPVSVVL